MLKKLLSDILMRTMMMIITEYNVVLMVHTCLLIEDDTT
jgi:hypothetical protein